VLDCDLGQLVNKIDEDFIRNVNDLLEKAGWNVSRLAREIDFTPQYVHKILKRGVPNTDVLKKIADALKTDPDALLKKKSQKTEKLAHEIPSALLHRLELFSAIPTLDDYQVDALLIQVRRFVQSRSESEAIKKNKDVG
jgi:transcriptional regulator with XRE-family HTH domain